MEAGGGDGSRALLGYQAKPGRKEQLLALKQPLQHCSSHVFKHPNDSKEILFSFLGELHCLKCLCWVSCPHSSSSIVCKISPLCSLGNLGYCGGLEESICLCEIKPRPTPWHCQANLKQTQQTLQSCNDNKIVSCGTVYKSMLQEWFFSSTGYWWIWPCGLQIKSSASY